MLHLYPVVVVVAVVVFAVRLVLVLDLFLVLLAILNVFDLRTGVGTSERAGITMAPPQ